MLPRIVLLLLALLYSMRPSTGALYEGKIKPDSQKRSTNRTKADRFGLRVKSPGSKSHGKWVGFVQYGEDKALAINMGNMKTESSEDPNFFVDDNHLKYVESLPRGKEAERSLVFFNSSNVPISYPILRDDNEVCGGAFAEIVTIDPNFGMMINITGDDYIGGPDHPRYAWVVCGSDLPNGAKDLGEDDDSEEPIPFGPDKDGKDVNYRLLYWGCPGVWGDGSGEEPKNLCRPVWLWPQPNQG